MLKFNIYSCIRVFVLGLLLSLWSVGSALAADETKKYGNWLMHCSQIDITESANTTTTEVPTKEVCALFQSVAARNRPRFGLTVLISKDDGTTPVEGDDVGLIKILVPLGVFIPTGVGMNIDSVNLGKTGFLRCLPNGCTAVATLSSGLLAQLKAAKTASFTLFLTPEDGLTIPIKLDGLIAGFDALK